MDTDYPEAEDNIESIMEQEAEIARQDQRLSEYSYYLDSIRSHPIIAGSAGAAADEVVMLDDSAENSSPFVALDSNDETTFQPKERKVYLHITSEDNYNNLSYVSVEILFELIRKLKIEFAAISGGRQYEKRSTFGKLGVFVQSAMGRKTEDHTIDKSHISASGKTETDDYFIKGLLDTIETIQLLDCKERSVRNQELAIKCIKEIIDSMRDCITFEMCKRPVILNDGNTYEYSSIFNGLGHVKDDLNQRCPLSRTRIDIQHCDLDPPTYPIFALIQKYFPMRVKECDLYAMELWGVGLQLDFDELGLTSNVDSIQQQLFIDAIMAKNLSLTIYFIEKCKQKLLMETDAKSTAIELADNNGLMKLAEESGRGNLFIDSYMKFEALSCVNKINHSLQNEDDINISVSMAINLIVCFANQADDIHSLYRLFKKLNKDEPLLNLLKHHQASIFYIFQGKKISKAWSYVIRIIKTQIAILAIESEKAGDLSDLQESLDTTTAIYKFLQCSSSPWFFKGRDTGTIKRLTKYQQQPSDTILTNLQEKSIEKCSEVLSLV